MPGTVATAAAAAAPATGDENLWQSLLRDVTASRGVDTRNIVLLGARAHERAPPGWVGTQEGR